MELTKEICLKNKEDRRKQLRELSIDEKIRRVEELRNRVQPIKELRRKRTDKSSVLKEK
jgi:hypothetical protein